MFGTVKGEQNENMSLRDRYEFEKRKSMNTKENYEIEGID